MNGFDKMNSKSDIINKVVDTLKLINNSGTFSIMDKDIILQQLREAYMAVLEMDTGIPAPCGETVVPTEEPAVAAEVQQVPEISRQEEQPFTGQVNPEMTAPELSSAPEPETEQIEEEVTIRETFGFSYTSVTENMEKEETPVMEEPAVAADQFPEIKEPELFAEEEEPEAPAASSSTGPAPHTIPVPDLSYSSRNPVQEFEGDDDILQFLSTTPKPAPQPEAEERPVAPAVSHADTSPSGPAVAEVLPPENPEVIVQPEQEVRIEQSYRAEVTVEATVPAQKRSLNDLLTEKKEDNSLNTKFQNAKIVDLTKSISINDKFLFIKELFRNKGEEFSQAIQALNNCHDIEEAFGLMEKLKKHYFWDSTSPAYLALCDLVRRKF